MAGRWGDVSGHVERRRDRWQVVVELGEQPYRQCPACRKDRRADGRRKGSPRWWTTDGPTPSRCPDCDADLVEEIGRRQERIGGFTRKRDAEEELGRLIAEHRAGRDPSRDALTLNEWLDRWLDLIEASVRIEELAPRTAAGYESHVRNYLRPRLGHLELRRLTPAHVSNLMRSIQADGLSPSTAARVRATLSRVLSDAMRHEHVHRNAAQIAKPPRVDRPPPSAFTEDELDRILVALEDHRLGPMFLFALYTGLRSSELRGLRWSDVDLDRATFQIRRGLHRVPKKAERVVERSGLVPSKPKTEDSGSRLPMSRQAVELLRQHRERQDGELAEIGLELTENSCVFTSTVGTPLDHSNVLKQWKDVLREAGVDYWSDDGRGRGLHELRRTFATRLRDLGVPLEDVQRLGRWSSPQVLLELYSATSDDRLRRAAQQAADAIGATVDSETEDGDAESGRP